MLKIPKNVKIGTKVIVAGVEGFVKLCSIDESQLQFKIEGYEGSFQWGHVMHYSNK